ncbi:MAG: hypothetical protein NC242_05850 [Roseburia sp.]|nr:hypothetical protein [Roseburia sp.]MCM1432225.1 hypothetical protein [Muribaculaceae bacterium]
MKKEQTMHGDIEEKIKALVVQAAETELAFVDAGSRQGKTPEIPPNLLARLARKRNRRQLLRVCCSAAAVAAILLFAGNLETIALAGQWVQEKIQHIFHGGGGFVPDTQSGGESEEPDAGTALFVQEETTESGELPAESEDLSGLYWNDEKGLFLGGGLWLPEYGPVDLVCQQGEDHARLAFVDSGDWRILYWMESQTAWEYESLYHEFRPFIEDYNEDGCGDLLLAEIYSDAEGKSRIVGELFFGQEEGGFVSGEQFVCDTGLFLGYASASASSGYMYDGLSVAWTENKISLLYTDMDSVQPGQVQSFYAWSEDGGTSWEEFSLDGLELTAERNGEVSPVSAGTPVWHRDFAGGGTVAVFDGEVVSVLHLTQEGVRDAYVMFDRIQENSFKRLTEVYFAEPQRGYFAFSYEGYEDMQRRPQLYGTKDGGASWELVDLGIEGDVVSENDSPLTIWDTVYRYGEVYAVHMQEGRLVTDVLMQKMDNTTEVLIVPLPTEGPSFSELVGN